MDTPLITIGITSYNAQDTINRAINSAKAQDWQNTEIIVVDDASKDGTRDILTKHEANITVIMNEQNQGVAASRNKIIETAKGEFIAFFDDDDESHPTRLTQQYAIIIKQEKQSSPPPLILCHCARKQHYPDTSKRIELPLMGFQGDVVARRILYGKPESGSMIGSMATCSQMARTKTYRDLGGFDEKFRRCEDTDLSVRAALQNALFVGTQEPLVTQTITLAGDKKLEQEHKYSLLLLEKHKGFLEQEGQYKHTKAWLDLKFKYYENKKAAFAFGMLALLLRHPALTAKRLFWAIPNRRFNAAYKRLKAQDSND